MTITEKIKKIKSIWLKYEFMIWVIILLVFGTGLAFGFGQLSAIEAARQPVMIEYLDLEEGSGSQIIEGLNLRPGGQVGASISGTRYYFPWCGGLNRINPENLIWFDSRQAAEAAGYTPAANCRGM